MSTAELVIRAARDNDLASISAIQTASPEAAQWPPQDYLQYACLVAVADGEVVGFIVFRTVSAEEHEILNLAVAPGRRRQGIARRLIAAVLQTPGAWFLEVRQSNAVARKFYCSMGFTDAGVRPAYYEDSHEPGIVMSFCS